MTANTALPPGSYVVDPQASHVGFEARLALGLRARGRFARYRSVLTIGDSPATSSLTLTVETDSVQTGIRKRDEHLRADNVLGAGSFPTFEFRSTQILEVEDGYDVEGVLCIRDVDRPVAFHAAPVPQAGPARYTAELTVTPGDFGVTRRGTTKALEVLLDVVLVPQPATAPA